MLLRLNHLSSMTTRKGFVLDAPVHQRAGFHDGKTQFCQSENGANEDQSMVLSWMPKHTREWFSRR